MTSNPGSGLTRREWILGMGAAGLAGCASRRGGLGAEERRLLFHATRPLPVVSWPRHRPDPTSVLRRRALSARSLPADALGRLDALMRETLAKSQGVGLAAPQVGVGRRVILVVLQDRDHGVLTCLDPQLRPLSSETEEGYEACLSVPGVGGLVRRHRRLEVTFHDLRGRPQKRISEGWEARIFQHEVDHLDGVLYLDRLIGPLLPIDEVRRRRKARTWADGELPWLANRRLAPGAAEPTGRALGRHGSEGLLL